MPQDFRTRLRRVSVYLIYFLKWTVLAGLSGGLCGAVGALFHHVVEGAGMLFAAHRRMLWLLPAAGLAIVWLYQFGRGRQDRGTNMVLASLHSGEPVPPQSAVRIFFATALTHLCGGSAGREGAALMIGAGLASCLEKPFRLEGQGAKQMTMCGMAGLFSAVFGTPVTAALFSLEVSSVGVMRYAGLYPCLASSLTAWMVSSHLGTEAADLPQAAFPPENSGNLLRVALLAAVCALCAIFFLSAMHLAGHLYRRFLPNAYLRAAAGGGLVILATLLLGTRAYNGAGMDVAASAVGGETIPWWAFLAKILLTALTMGAGFKGGEIVPAFVIGATLGCTVGPLLGLAPGTAAAIGLVALFCGVVNCPVASIVLSVELFGGHGLGLFAVACGVSYLMSGYYTLYAEQRIVYSKLGGADKEAEASAEE